MLFLCFFLFFYKKSIKFMTHDRCKFYNYFDPLPYIAPKVCCMNNGEREKGENSWWCWALEKPRHIFLLCLILHRRKKQLCMAIFYHVFKKVWYFLLNFYFEVFCKIWNQLFLDSVKLFFSLKTDHRTSLLGKIS